MCRAAFGNRACEDVEGGEDIAMGDQEVDVQEFDENGGLVEGILGTYAQKRSRE
jgi:hypothetical protein